MRLFFFNLDKVIPAEREIHTIIPAIIFSKDKVVYSSNTGTLTILMESDFLERNPKQTIAFFKSFYLLSLGEKYVNNVENLLTRGFKVMNKKIRTKEDFALIAKGKKLYKTILKMVVDYFKWTMEINYLEKVNAYAKSGDITLTAISRSATTEIEGDESSTEIFLHVLTNKDDFIFCTEHICAESEIAGINDTDLSQDFFQGGIFKTDIFSLPGCVMLKHSKLPLLREEMQPELKLWQEQACKLQEDLRETSFSADNLSMLREKAASFLDASALLKKKTEDSIYFQQLANGEFGEYAGTLSLGITSRRHFLEKLKVTGQISNEATEELKEYFTNNNMIDKIVLFFIHTVPTYPAPNNKIKHEQIEPLWEASFE